MVLQAYVDDSGSEPQSAFFVPVLQVHDFPITIAANEAGEESDLPVQDNETPAAFDQPLP